MFHDYFWGDEKLTANYEKCVWANNKSFSAQFSKQKPNFAVYLSAHNYCAIITLIYKKT